MAMIKTQKDFDLRIENNNLKSLCEVLQEQNARLRERNKNLEEIKNLQKGVISSLEITNLELIGGISKFNNH